MKQIILIVVALSLAFLAYLYLQPEPPTAVADSITTDSINSEGLVFSDEELANIPPTYNESVVNTELEIGNSEAAYANSLPSTPPNLQATAPTPAFICDGRKHCSQMTSCAEATYFSNNCADTKMDGNNDGIPCEQQWCN